MEKNLFRLQLSSEEDSVGAPGVFRQRISHPGPQQQGGGTTGGITSDGGKREKKEHRRQLVVKLRLRTKQGGDGEVFREFGRLIIDMRDGTRHQLTALNDGVNYKMAGC